MATTSIPVAENTYNVPSTRRVIDINKSIAYVNPDVAQLTLVLMRAKNGTRTVTNPEFKWIEKDMLPTRYDQVNGGHTTGDTVIAVDNGARWQAGDLAKRVLGGEVMRIESVSSNNLTVTRSVGGTSGTDASTIADNEDLFKIGTSFAEGADVGVPRSHEETYPANYTEIFRTPFGATRTAQNSEWYTGKPRKTLRKEKMAEHRVLLESALLWGEKGEDTSNKLRYTGGLLDFLTTTKDFGAVVTEPEIEDGLATITATAGSGDSRTLVAAPLWISILDQIAGARQQVVPRADTYGVAITRIVTGHCELNVIKHKLLTNGSNGTGYGSHAFVLDLSKIKYCPLNNSDTKLLLDRQGNGVDGWIDEYLTEAGFQIENPELHSVWYGDSTMS